MWVVSNRMCVWNYGVILGCVKGYFEVVFLCCRSSVVGVVKVVYV